MKVCLLTTSFPRFEGDYAGVFVYDLAIWLTRLGVQVRVVAPGEVNVPKQEVMNGIEINRFSYFLPRRWQRIAYLGGIPANLRNSWLAWLQLPFFLCSFLFSTLRACRDCDLIHAYWILAGFVGSWATLFRRLPVVLTVQGSDINASFDNAVLRRFRSLVIQRVDRVIAVSRPLAERVKLLGATEENVQVIPNGVDPAIFSNGSAAHFGYQLLWVGRMSSEKGVEYLVQAMGEVVTRYPQARLTLVGDGPCRAQIEQLIAEMRLEKHVTIAGMVHHDEVPEYHRGADLFVLPSLSEGLPLALVEAMSAGKPVVATSVGGIPDVLVDHGDFANGRLVPVGDSRALAIAIGEIFDNPQAARMMGKQARLFAESRLSWSRLAEQTVSLYGELLPE